MTQESGVPGADALRALLGMQAQLEDAVTDKEWSAAAGMICGGSWWVMNPPS